MQYSYNTASYHGNHYYHPLEPVIIKGNSNMFYLLSTVGYTLKYIDNDSSCSILSKNTIQLYSDHGNSTLLQYHVSFCTNIVIFNTLPNTHTHNIPSTQESILIVKTYNLLTGSKHESENTTITLRSVLQI